MVAALLGTAGAGESQLIAGHASSYFLLQSAYLKVSPRVR